MLDIGWTELVVIAIVLIVVVGPKDLPPMLRTFGKMMTKFRGMASDFRQQFDEALKEADLDDVRKTLSDAQKLNPAHSLREAMNPLRQMGNDIKADLQKATVTPAKPATPAVESSSDTATEVVAPTPAIDTAPAIDTVAAAAIASATRQSKRAAAEKEVEKPKRVTKPKADVATVPTEPVVAVKAAKTAKAASKNTAAVVADPEKPKPRKAAVKTKSKGEA